MRSTLLALGSAVLLVASVSSPILAKRDFLDHLRNVYGLGENVKCTACHDLKDPKAKPSKKTLGAMGTSSGGHILMLNQMRPKDPVLNAIPYPEHPQLDCKIGYYIGLWVPIDPLARYLYQRDQAFNHCYRRTCCGSESRAAAATSPAEDVTCNAAGFSSPCYRGGV